MIKIAKEAGQITHNHDEKRHPNHVLLDNENVKTTLSDAGISHNLSSRAQKIADVLGVTQAQISRDNDTNVSPPTEETSETDTNVSPPTDVTEPDSEPRNFSEFYRGNGWRAIFEKLRM
jgi:hypothetical protein